MTVTEDTHLSVIVPLSFSTLINGWSFRRLILTFKICSVGASITNRSGVGRHRRGLVCDFNMAPVFGFYKLTPIRTNGNFRNSGGHWDRHWRASGWCTFCPSRTCGMEARVSSDS